MSFSGNVKSEMCRTQVQKPCCALAELYGILLFSSAFGPQAMRIITRNERLSRRITQLCAMQSPPLEAAFAVSAASGGRRTLLLTDKRQLAALLLRQIRGCAFGEIGEPQVTGWGERADIWLEEDAGELNSSCFNYCTLYSHDNDTISFFDYLPVPRGDHHDFYQRQQYVDIFCDIAKNKPKQFSDYDTNVIRELCQKGYITDNNGQYTAALPVYTAAQYGKIEAAVERYLNENLGQTLIIIDKIAAGVYTEHCPKPLAAAAKRISGHSKFIQAVAKPTKLLIERGYLNTDYADNEIPCAFVVIGK